MALRVDLTRVDFRGRVIGRFVLPLFLAFRFPRRRQPQPPTALQAGAPEGGAGGPVVGQDGGVERPGVVHVDVNAPAEVEALVLQGRPTIVRGPAAPTALDPADGDRRLRQLLQVSTITSGPQGIL